jgi:hypothetical protein
MPERKSNYALRAKDGARQRYRHAQLDHILAVRSILPELIMVCAATAMIDIQQVG